MENVNMLKLAEEIMKMQEEWKTYTVQQAHTVWFEVEVEAESEEQAVDVARQLFENGEGANLSIDNWDTPEPRDVFWVREDTEDGEPFFMDSDGNLIEGDVE